MKKFFVPSSWEKNSETVKFKPIKGNLSAPAPSSGKKTKQKKKNKNKTRSPQLTKGPLAPSNADATATTNTPKVKSGRVEKRKTKKQKQQQKLQLTPALAKAAAASIGSSGDATSPTSALEAKLKEQLVGGRFRYINEQLYTMDSSKAAALFREDKDAFGAYHTGYRHQVEKWPLNPLERIIKTVKRLPKALEVGDFGCGEGKLAQSVSNKVYSMDLVSCRDDIIACDMANTPLTAESLDVAVYCLSLMGTNLKEYLLEANRVLRMGGLIYIAEIQSRFEDVHSFVRALEACGFQLVHKDLKAKVFYFFQFKKVRNVGKVAVVPDIALKPCLYRKR